MKKTNESGRSMVEMLGVLAIIGVLSIGGIAGYTTAMNRYRANEIIDMASKYATVSYTAFQTYGARTSGAVLGREKLSSLSDTGLTSSNTVNGATISKATITQDDGTNQPTTTTAATTTLSAGSYNKVSILITFDTTEVCRAAASALGYESSTAALEETTKSGVGLEKCDSKTILFVTKHS